MPPFRAGAPFANRSHTDDADLVPEVALRFVPVDDRVELRDFKLNPPCRLITHATTSQSRPACRSCARAVWTS